MARANRHYCPTITSCIHFSQEHIREERGPNTSSTIHGFIEEKTKEKPIQSF